MNYHSFCYECLEVKWTIRHRGNEIHPYQTLISPFFLKMNVLSFHLLIEADHNRIVSKGGPSDEDRKAIEAADAVILPQGCRESLYRMARKHCAHVLPNYDVVFQYPGKTGQDAFFKKMHLPHPATHSFQDLRAFSKSAHSFTYPYVFKFSWGGEGNNVFLIKSAEDLARCLEKAEEWEQQDKTGFLLQEYVPTGGRSLRVVVIGNNFYSYWRQGQDGEFYTNLAKGASIEHESSPELQEKAVTVLKDVCRKTGINLAGFDFLFSTDDPTNTPLFLEINVCFRCKGLGGVDAYNRLLEQDIKEWLNQISQEKSKVF